MKEDLVTVIIPAYNHGIYIKETITSIMAQTYSNIELLIIDDESMDDTWDQMCQMYSVCAQRFVSASFQTHKHSGICDSLNKLIDQAKGKYIYIIASDDTAKPFAIEMQVDFLQRHLEYAQVVGDNEIIDEHSNRVYWDKNRNNVSDEASARYKTHAQFLKEERTDIDFNSDDFGSYKSLINGGNYIPNGNLFLKRALIEVGKYNKNAPLDDLYINMQIAQRYKIKFIDEILFSYRWHSNNTIKKVRSSLTQQTIYFELFYAPKNAKTIAFINEFSLYETKKIWFLAIEKYKSLIRKRKYLRLGSKKFLLKESDIVFKHYDFETPRKYKRRREKK
jgi:alpha-1,3-rhamnosyltransferase